ncbi:DUF5671 domain-containing protein [Paracoccus sediminicola]|uniref:DUF5671 domain-containing protein n=1 Tax=Paracoccus sediminicola TaxID=3017783 RepID=UPI0022F0C577|nr:DUF5671 domain-containing protein [Paracoccus sediminicola]WBU57581.1 DUF5671 domain-containing protein [Paracoccus sediminicola]
MQLTDSLTDFVRQALAAGRSRDEIDAALTRAGWSDREREHALMAWGEEPGMPPVPRPRSTGTARDALMFGLLFITLGIVAFHLGALGFDVIEELIPMPAQHAEPSAGSMRFSMAALIGFVPIFLILHRNSMRTGKENGGTRRSPVRRWLASVTLLLAMLTLLGDLVFVVYALLNGEVTMRFFAKAALVALIAGLIYGYYRGETDG